MTQQLTPHEALSVAVEAAGGQSALARLCGVSQTAVWKWLQSSKRLPAEHALLVEKATGVSRHLLRPDIYPLGIVTTAPFDGEPPLECGPVLTMRDQGRKANRGAVLDRKFA